MPIPTYLKYTLYFRHKHPLKLRQCQCYQIFGISIGFALLTMATAQFRTLKEFCPDSEAVKVYLECVQLYFVESEVPEGMEVPF